MDDKRKARTIGGMLLLLATGLAVTPFRLAHDLLKSFHIVHSFWTSFQAGFMESSYFYVLSLEMLFNFIFLIAWSYIALIFFLRKKRFITCFLGILACNIFLYGLDMYLTAYVTTGQLSADQMSVNHMAVMAARLSFWGFYLNLAARAKQTFVF